MQQWMQQQLMQQQLMHQQCMQQQWMGRSQQPEKREPVEQPAEQPPGKVSRTLTTTAGPMSSSEASSTVATEQEVMAQVRAAEAQVQETSGGTRPDKG